MTETGRVSHGKISSHRGTGVQLDFNLSFILLIRSVLYDWLAKIEHWPADSKFLKSVAVPNRVPEGRFIHIKTKSGTPV